MTDAATKTEATPAAPPWDAERAQNIREKGHLHATQFLHDRAAAKATQYESMWRLGVAEVVMHKFGRMLVRPQAPVSLGVDLVLPWKTRWALFRRGRVTVSARVTVRAVGTVEAVGHTVALELDGKLLDATVAPEVKVEAPAPVSMADAVKAEGGGS